MTEAVKHTPGPWEARPWPRDEGKFQIWGSHPGSKGSTFRAWVASVRAGELSDETNEANARLIAAAPDMLKILKRIASSVDFNGTCHPLFDGMQKQMTDAIAKAEGRS